MTNFQYIDNLPPKSQIFDYWKERLPALKLHIDWVKPGCWVCQFHYGTRYDIKRSDVTREEILRCWDKIPLQRCHIIPRPLGGTDDASNLFLMCRECHDRMPNTSIPEIFFEWARVQSSDVRESYKLHEALRDFSIQSTIFRDFAKLLESEEFGTWRQDKIGIHRPQSNYAPVSSRLTPATLVGLAAYYLRTLAIKKQ